MKMSFRKMANKNPNKHNEMGAVVYAQVGDNTYAVCPIRKVE